MREVLAAADHDFVLSEPVSQLKRLREKLLAARRRGSSRSARRGRRYLNILAAGFFVVTTAAILLNALAWQRTRHPAPLFSHAAPAAPAAPAKEPTIDERMVVPAPRPQPMAPPVPVREKPIEKPPEKPLVQKSLAEKPPVETLASGHPHQTRVNASPAKPHDGISRLLKTPSAVEKPSVQKALPAPQVPSATMKAVPAVPSKPVLAAQRALVKLGFVLNPDGVAGVTTRRAIERYERDHGLPVRGELTPALMRRLNAEAGVAGE